MATSSYEKPGPDRPKGFDMEQNRNTETPEQRLVHVAKIWRARDGEWIAAKQIPCNLSGVRDASDAEYVARRDLRKAVDEVKP